MLLLPSHPEFYRILAIPPPDPDRSKCFIARAGSWVLEAADEHTLEEYLEGGEYDQVLQEQGQHDLLYLPDSLWT
jgi:hypothetical protein